MGRVHRWGLAVLVAAVAAAVPPVRAAGAPGPRWTAAWGAAAFPQPADDARSTAAFGGPVVSDRTVRMLMRPAVGGSAARLRLSNETGAHPVVIGRATAGMAVGRGIRPGTLRDLHFGGRRHVTIAPGRAVLSDPIPLRFAAGEDLAFSAHVLAARGPFSGHEEHKRVSWWSAPGSGDWTQDETGAGLAMASTSVLWLDRLDVMSEPRPVVVAIGDSITDGYGAVVEQHQDWPSRLADRLHGSVSVINAGINRNTVTRTGCGICGPPIVDRLHRDVLSVPGVTHVVVFAGTNDIAQGVPAHRLADGLAEVARRARERGITVIGATITPRDDRLYGWDPAVHGRVRHQVNSWMRRTTAFDAVLDFDAVVRDPTSPESLHVRYDSGDRLHPNAAGLAALAAAVDPRLLGRR